MLSFIIIFVIGVSALLLVQRLDIECVHQPRRVPRHSSTVTIRLAAEGLR